MVEDQFPIGMRVLVVEEDLICLKNLERLLQECQYHVTIAQSGITALNLLRENTNNFDLLMTNVQIPDIDGFKLLELVGTEVPVILFSSNDDPKMVMRGVLHGACDYLLNPFRMEKLQVIWQHVIRKNMNRKRSNCETFSSYRKIGLDSTMATNLDQNEKPSEKRKNHREDDVKKKKKKKKKPRVAWSTDLHHKFVDAVNRLGIDKAVPRKILHLMNVENLTKLNVASHLQKYRLYLKRISSVEKQQANIVTAIGEVGEHLQTLNPLMMESNPLDRSVVSQQSLFSLPSLENKNIWPSTLQLSGTNPNLPINAAPLNVVESGGNLDYNYRIHYK